MRNDHAVAGRLAAASMLCLSLALAGCGQGAQQQPAQEQPAQEQAEQQAEQTTGEQPAEQKSPTGASVPDGTYEGIDVETDSSMFRAESCTLTAEGGSYTATLTLPGEGFSRLFFGTAEQASQAADDQVYDYHLDDKGKYTFDIPVEALDEELQVAAYGQRRDTWYDHTIVFHAPAS